MAAIADVFEMHPAQAGMLLHTLMEPGSGIYFEQLWCSLDGKLDVEAFRAAWQRVIERHDMLRAECHWVDLHRPVQVIYDQAEPEWQIGDWSDLDPAAQGVVFEEWLKADRRRGFQMDKAPLLRFGLFRLAGNRHRFVWSFHHLLMDGWCGALLVREMLRLYAGKEPAKPPLPYRRYIDWRGVQDGDAAEAYWRNELAGLDGPTAIGTGIGKEAPHSDQAVELRKTLSQECAEGLRALSRTRRLTLATILQGAWALLLSRYSEQDDVIFGAVQSGRPADLPGAEDMIGLFLNTVPVRVRVDDDERLDAWLASIQSGQAGRERFGHIGLADIQRCSGLGATTALFDTLVIVENYPLGILDAVETEGAALRVEDAGSYERTNFPLSLRVFPGGSIELVLGVDPSQMEPEAARRLLGHYEAILNAFGARPDVRLREVGMVGTEERDFLLSLGRGPERAVSAPVPHQIVGRAKEKPDAVAIEFMTGQGKQVLTYAELVAQAGSLATTLQQRQLDRGAVVTVWMERGPDLVVALLGVMMSGAAYLPIDPDYPDERIDYMLRDAAVSLVVADAVSFERARRLDGIDVLVPDTDGALSADPNLPEPDDIAYLLYTSGSTGKPKGVPISHLNLANLIAAMCEQPGIGAHDRLLAVTTVGFDIAGLEIFGPLAAGGTLLLTDAAACRDGASLSRLIEATNATIMQATPSGWRLLLNANWQGSPDLKMLCGGEALDSQLARTLLAQGRELWNMYGPTETTIWSAAVRVEPELLEGHTVPVGSAIANTHLLLLDGRGNPAPVGVPGELCIGGLGLSSGYWQRPELTADKFVPNAFRSASYDRPLFYRTGDRVRWRADGHIEFLGRMDNQVKLRGHRIELDEIEGQLARFPGVAQVLAHVADNGTGPRLVAYLRWTEAEPDDVAGLLRAHLQTTLPAYMLPSAYVSLDAFPLTPNGKIDRKALPEPQPAPKRSPEIDLRFDEPAASVARIWCDVLDLDRVGSKDNFFEIGGHSLLAVNVQRLIREQLDVDLLVADLFRFPTLETLAAYLETRLGGGAAPVQLPERGEARAAGRERLAQRRLSQRPVRA